MNREKTTAILLVVLLTSMALAPVLAVKPSKPLAGAEKVAWHLSADVMPAPPYGTQDIPESDVASKLIVNQPNGAVDVVITGVMNGLQSYATYTVFLAKAWSPSWSLIGDWTHVGYLGSDEYRHKWTVEEETETGFSGTGESIGGQVWTFTGTKDGYGSIEITIVYDYPSVYWAVLSGIVDYYDRSISGTWQDSNDKSGTWHTESGSAKGRPYPGLFNGAVIPPFTFITDGSGSASWHENLRDDYFDGSGDYTLSVWINAPGATILISDNFTVTVD